MSKKTKGVNWEIDVLQFVQDSRKPDENFSNCVNRLVKVCKAGALDDMAIPVLKKFLSFFSTTALTTSDKTRFKNLFTDSESDYIDTLFQELRT